MSRLVASAALWQLAAVLAGSSPAFAQHLELASNGDGSVLYVTSYSVLRDTATPMHAQRRLYRIGPDGVQLFAERGPAPAAPGLTFFSSSDGIAVPQPSDDGETVAYTIHGVCVADPCVIGSVAELKGTTTLQLGVGTVQMSRNGRWAVISSDPNIRVQDRTAELIDLNSGQRSSVPQPVVVPFAVASDGSILVLQGGLGLWRDGQVTTLPLGERPIRPLALSDNARVFVYSEVSVVLPKPGGIQLKARDIGSGRDTVLFQPNGFQLPQFLGMSDDGRLVLYSVIGPASNGPAFLADTSTGQATQVMLPDGEQPVAGTLSGDGSSAFIATTSGRILKFRIQGLGSTSETLIAPTPDAGHTGLFPRGSLKRLKGYLPGSVDDLRGRILLDGRSIPVLFVDSNGVAIQVPWEQHFGDVPFLLDVPSDSPFIHYELVPVEALAPVFEPLDTGQTAVLPIKLVKGDFSGLVDTPPQPGDIVIAYMTGLGPVKGQPQTAIPTPIGALMPLDGSFTCTFSQQASPSDRAQAQSTAETLFVGLAPSLIGIYQVTFRMPADAGQGRIVGVTCQLTTPLGEGSLGLFLLGGS